MVTEQQLNTFINLVASGDFSGAASFGLAAGVPPDVIAAYVNANAVGLGLPAGFQISGQNVSSLAGNPPSFLAGPASVAPAAPAPAAPAPVAPVAPAAPTGSPLDQARRNLVMSTGANRTQAINDFLVAATSAGLSPAEAAGQLRQSGITMDEISRVPALSGYTQAQLAGMSGGAYRAPVTGTLTPDAGTSNIDPLIAPYLREALEESRSLFLGTPPAFFPGTTYVPPSAQTLEALDAAEMVSRGAAPFFEQARGGFMTGLTGLEKTARGGFLGSNPYLNAMVTAASRPLTQQFQEQVLPGISSQYSAAGRYGSGAMGRAQERATEGFTRALGDVSTSIIGQDYARERGFQEAAMRDIGTAATMVPEFYRGFLAPTETMARVGAQREAIAAQPLEESMRRFEFGQRQPYEQLTGYLSSIYGSPLASRGMVPPTTENRSLANIGTALSFLGQAPAAITGAREGWNFVSSLLS